MCLYIQHKTMFRLLNKFPSLISPLSKSKKTRSPGNDVEKSFLDVDTFSESILVSHGNYGVGSSFRMFQSFSDPETL